MNTNTKCKQWRMPFLLILFTLFFCWLFCGRYGVFGSKVDWISQHSVFPDYFRQQFYDTGDFFPEFAAGIGGGQNIYNFAYYGLYSPVFLLSYLLPFVKMSDYLIAASFTCLASGVVLLYFWLIKRGFSQTVSFLTALLFLLSAPMIFQSYNQIMFVNYMPFLCMALWGVDSFLEKGKPLLYLSGVFLMIMTSFYFSIGGILVLILYGLHRYFMLQDSLGKKIRFLDFLRDGIRFLGPILTAILLSAFFLVPTAMALHGGREGETTPTDLSLFIPTVKLSSILYHPYAIGLTTLILTVLIAGLAWKRRGERILIWSTILILTIPFFSYLLNGGLYIRDKVLIPFLPVLCYLIACYMQKQQEEARPLWRGLLPYILTIILIFTGNTESMPSFSRFLLALDVVIMAGCYLLFYELTRFGIRTNRKSLRTGSVLCLLIPPILFLGIYDQSFQTQADTMLDSGFYQKIADYETKKATEFITRKQEFYRMEQIGTPKEEFADLNRIWSTGQYSNSVYSSVYNADYQEFRTKTFELEEPYRNFLMQSVSRNPVYQRFMGIKYLITQEDVPGYQWDCTIGNTKVLKNDNVSPIAYATNRLLNKQTYDTLPFPYNQTTLLDYAVVEKGGQKETPDSDSLKITSGTMTLPALQKTGNTLTQTDETITAVLKQTEILHLNLADLFPNWNENGQNEQEHVLFLQFHVKNKKPSSDVSITLEKERNKLSARSHIYYNHNTTFTYAVPLEKGQQQISLTLGKGSYQFSNLQLSLGTWQNPASNETLYQSEFHADKNASKGNQLKGTIQVDQKSYFITTIPYDSHFEVLVDGKNVSYEKVNTAFLGFPLKQGKHKIEISYHAPGAAAGKLLSFAGILICLFHLISGFQHSKQTSRRIEI